MESSLLQRRITVPDRVNNMPRVSQRTWDQVLGSQLFGATAITSGHVLRKAVL